MAIGKLHVVNAEQDPLQRPESPEAVLEELFLLLEEYGPQWYTEVHHDRAVAALLQAKQRASLEVI